MRPKTQRDSDRHAGRECLEYANGRGKGTPGGGGGEGGEGLLGPGALSELLTEIHSP